MGVPRGSWFVCLHVREPGYHMQWHKKHPGTRNTHPYTYLKAIQEIVDRGGYVVRMDDKSMTPMPPMEGLVDYAHCPEKSDFMDIFLCATCRFFMGTNSGLGLVPPLFGVPCAMTNWSPIGLRQRYPQDLFIPKLVYSIRRGGFLTFGEMFTSPAGWGQFSDYFKQNDLFVTDNTPHDLRDLAIEMIDTLDNPSCVPRASLELRAQFEAVALSHGSYRGAHIGCRFLQKYAALLSSSGTLEIQDSAQARRLMRPEVPGEAPV